jgi:prenylcysteine alpha-carboxyl methylesterase
MDLRPHNLAEEPSDPYTRILHQIIPNSLQTGFRDAGGFKGLCDSLVSISALAMIPYFPRFIRLGLHQYSYSYGPLSEQLIHVIDLHHFDNNNNNNDSGGAAAVRNEAERNKIAFDGNILAFVHGGGWGSGKPWMYRLTAEGLARRLKARYVILIQHPVFPVTNILEQRDMIYEAMKFINSEEWMTNNDHTKDATTNTNTNTIIGDGKNRNRKVFLSGHSSGANISALALIKAVKQKVKLADIFISLSGVYDIGKHYEWEKARGVHLISPMGGAAINPTLYPSCSPTIILRDWWSTNDNIKKYDSDHNGDNDDFAKFFPTETFILHGTDDTTVPCISSRDFAVELMKYGVKVHEVYPITNHVHPVLELLQSSNGPGPCSDALIHWYSRLYDSNKFVSKL